MKVCACTTRNCGSAFWVTNGSLRIKLSNESVSMITHDCDLEKVFPGNLLIEDNQLFINFNIFCCVNKCFKINCKILLWVKFLYIIFCHNIFHMFLFFNGSYSFFGLQLHFTVTNTEAATQKLFWTILFFCVCIFLLFFGCSNRFLVLL